MRYFIFSLSFVLMVSTVFADVIPTRVASKESTDTRTAVADRLETLGMSGDEAQAHANALPEDIASHYADSPMALQWVTGDEDEGPSPGEIAGGIVWSLVGAGTIAAAFAINGSKH